MKWRYIVDGRRIYFFISNSKSIKNIIPLQKREEKRIPNIRDTQHTINELCYIRLEQIKNDIETRMKKTREKN